ncbi:MULTISPECIES: helix-turn-helix transcriptional regulator [unclassified Streptomyces]|uniref:helix-turn-helix domain-containing protein n=1 Tax=unclassified Streptomyces TaxID=2593676 RepID=UPI000369A81C|nr:MULTISPECIES: helix-turn-helix transcriptional regulator [unclassified Streptomyces]MYT32041.1 helix-turn-helix domain-containing protein [Streptomyces sp. SID8354]
MKKNQQPPIVCRNCKRTFQRPRSNGRIPKYCSSRCRSAHYRGRRAPSPRRSYDADVERLSRSLLVKAQALDHAATHRAAAFPLDVVKWCEALRRDLVDITVVAVCQARADGATVPQVAKIMDIAPSTLKSNFSADKAEKVLAQRAARGPARPPCRPAALQCDTRPTRSEKERVLLPGTPGYALSRALSRLKREKSDVNVQQIAAWSSVSTSYIYRILSGERTPTWAVTRAFACACDADPDDLVFLWNQARGIPPDPAAIQTYDKAVRTLQAALRGLRLAATAPDIATLVQRAPTPLTPRTAQALLAPDPPPAHALRWPVVNALTAALNGDTHAIRKLHKRIDELTPHSGLPAEGFG